MTLHGLKCHYRYFSCICCIWIQNRWRWRQYVALHFHHHDNLKCHDINDEWCFRVVLESSYSLYNQAFSYNVSTVLLYAVVVSPLPLLNTSIIVWMFMMKSCTNLSV